MSVELNKLNVLDPNSFGDLKRLAREGNSPDALRAAAKQFEGLFMQMMLKAMREATPANGLFDNDQTRMLQSFQDQQMSMQMAQGSGIGLADVIFRQMGGEHLGVTREPRIGADGNPIFDLASVPRRAAISASRGNGEASPAGNVANGDARAAAGPGAPESSAGATPSVSERVGSFVGRVWSHAVDAARSIGVPPQFMVAQAALETGWGRAELRTGDGKPSFNVFNIKAGRSWKGPVVELPVTEYADGRPYTERARFRVYGSYAEAFQDFANLMRNNPRYANVLGQTDPAGFARSLQSAGYATDPLYADKLASIINGPTLRAALGG